MVNSREKEIVSILSKHKELTIHELAQALYVSTSTIRRDVHLLEEKNLVIHSYGKVRLHRLQATYTTPYQMRDALMYDVKETLAKEVAASGLIQNGNVIMLDASTTVSHLTNYLKAFVDVTVITSGIRSLCMLDDLEIPFISTGGIPVLRSHSFTGQHAIDVVRSYNADICFLSCHGLSEEGFLTDTSVAENDVRKEMMLQSKRKVLILDGTKLNHTCFHNLCSIAAFDDVFCNTTLPEAVLQKVKKFHLVQG